MATSWHRQPLLSASPPAVDDTTSRPKDCSGKHRRYDGDPGSISRSRVAEAAKLWSVRNGQAERRDACRMALSARMGDPVSGAAVRAGARAAGGLASAVWRRYRPDTSHAALERHADDLADGVRRVETPRLEQLGVTRSQGVNVSYVALARVRGAGGEDLGTLREVSQYYAGLRTGRLVVLGAPGAGKTVLGLHLLLDLLDHRRAQPESAQPVPVRVNAASWGEGTGFTAWLVDVLAADYGLLPKVARMPVDGGQVLPVLDGLDEMDPLDRRPRRARAAVNELNRPPWLGRPVIVTCRAAVYDAVRALGTGGTDAGLHAATGVSIGALGPARSVPRSLRPGTRKVWTKRRGPRSSRRSMPTPVGCLPTHCPRPGCSPSHWPAYGPVAQRPRRSSPPAARAEACRTSCSPR